MKIKKYVLGSFIATLILGSSILISCSSSSSDNSNQATESNNTQTYAPPAGGEGNLGEGGISKDQGQFWSSNLDLVTEDGSVANGVNTAFGVNETTGHIKGYPSSENGDQCQNMLELYLAIHMVQNIPIQQLLVLILTIKISKLKVQIL